MRHSASVRGRLLKNIFVYEATQGQTECEWGCLIRPRVASASSGFPALLKIFWIHEWNFVTIARYTLFIIAVHKKLRNHYFTKKLSFVKHDKKRFIYYSSYTSIFAYVLATENILEHGEKVLCVRQKSASEDILQKSGCENAHKLWWITLHTLFTFRTSFIRLYIFVTVYQLEVCICQRVVQSAVQLLRSGEKRERASWTKRGMSLILLTSF